MTAYLDHAATTPLRPEVLEAMLPYLTDHFGNPSGSHAVSRRAKQAIEEARDVVAAGLGCKPSEVVFTGGGTDADNLAILGAVGVESVACSRVEHHAVLHAVAAHPCRQKLLVDADEVGAAEVDLVSQMLANNETGVIYDLPAPRPGRLLHTDAVAAFPWVDVAAAARHADLISISAHKFGGPKGVGALAARSHVTLRPIIHGGGQEADRRSGTHNVAGIVGLAEAVRLTVEQRAATVERVGRLRDRLADGLLAAVPGAVETGERVRKIAGNCHLRFPGIESEALLVLLDEAGVCASAGSACASGAIEPSHVLTAMGIDRDEALSSVRLSLGFTTTDADVDLALKAVPDAVARLRGRA
jgi:cysteine desulfurase